MSPKAILPFVFALLLVQPAAAGNLAANGDEGGAAAVTSGRWREHELRFTYSGFTTKYSCDGLADKVRALLRSLGARADLQVRTYGCPSLGGGPMEFPGVKLRFATLEPDAAASPVPGVWREVRFDRDRPRPLEPGDCELLEQFRDRVLPLFTLRGMDDHTRCIPYQLSGTSLALRFEVFAPASVPDTARAGRR